MIRPSRSRRAPAQRRQNRNSGQTEGRQSLEQSPGRAPRPRSRPITQLDNSLEPSVSLPLYAQTTDLVMGGNLDRVSVQSSTQSEMFNQGVGNYLESSSTADLAGADSRFSEAGYPEVEHGETRYSQERPAIPSAAENQSVGEQESTDSNVINASEQTSEGTCRGDPDADGRSSEQQESGATGSESSDSEEEPSDQASEVEEETDSQESAESEQEEGGEQAQNDQQTESAEGESSRGGGGESESSSGEQYSGDAESTGDALVDFELAEHERWAGSFGEMGTAGSDERARFLLDQAGQGATAGAVGGLGMGFVMGAIGAGVGQIAGKRLATLAVSRGFAATPIPGLGSAIGGVMAVAGLAMRDWSQTADTIGRIGEGEGYEGLANDLEGIAEILDVATQVMDVLGGVMGAIALGMWVGTVLSAGTLSPVAASLSAIALGITAATTAIGLIISIVIRPVVVALRALHTFESQGDPAQIEAQGQQLQGAAGQISGAIAGAAAGRAGGAAGTRGAGRVDAAITHIQSRRTGGAPEMSAVSGPGPRVHAEVPEAPSSSTSAASALPAAASAGSAPAASSSLRPASTDGPVARSSRQRPRASGRREVSERVHSSELRDMRGTAERRMGQELSRDETLSLDARRTMTETIEETTAMASPGGRLESEFYDIPAHESRPRLRAGHERAWSHPAHGDRTHPDRHRQRAVEQSLRSEARAEGTEQMRAALRDPSLHTEQTLESLSHLSPRQRETLLEPPVTAAERRRLRAEGEVVPGDFPEGWQTHHLESVRDNPSTAHRGDVTTTVPADVHRQAGHDNDYNAPIETSSARDPRAMERPGFHMDREAVPRARRLNAEVARGSRSTGDIDADIRIQYEQSVQRAEARLARLRQRQADTPSPARERRIAALERETQAARGMLDSLGSQTPDGTSGPAASSPSRARSPSSPASAIPSNTETVRTSDRAAAMDQYHAQIGADPGRESGVWRGEDGTYYVMQGDAGSVAPPAASGRLELIYHSHPTEAGAAHQGLVTQPSQANGDLAVLQFQHGQGTPGQAQRSELHFPTYDQAGNHTGYGATQFGYDPTHPLPIQVSTTRPDGTASTQRYASFADYESRTGIQAGAATPADSTAARVAADARLQTDINAAQQRVNTIVSGTRGPNITTQGMRLGAEEGRQQVQAQNTGAQTEDNRPQRGPAYTTSISGEFGLEPGESVEIPINPPYEAPPGTPAELDILMERVHATQLAQDDLSETDRAMSAQASEQTAQNNQLGEAQAVTENLAAGRTAHQGTTDATDSTNAQQQSTAGEAVSALGQTAEHAAALTTLVGSLRVFQGLAHLFSYLPGSLGDSAEQASADCDGLINSLNRVSETDSTQASVESGRDNIEANAERISNVTTQGIETDAEISQGQQGVAELQVANQERLAETQATQNQARNERQQARASEEEAQSTHDNLESELQSWAQSHQQTREDAIQTAIARYTELGYQVSEG